MNFKNKINIDFEIEQYALMEATNKWIELMIKTREMNKIFNETITMNATSIDESFKKKKKPIYKTKLIVS
jgi:hypothetical protein